MTDSSAYLINHSPKKSAILSTLFGTSGADFNMVRLPLGASDFIANPSPGCKSNRANCFETYDDTPRDTALSPVTKSDPHFTIAHDTTNVIPVLKSAKALNSHFKIIALPWSAPGWMKISTHYLSSCSGSSDYLNPADYSLYAAYLTRAAKAYQEEGIPFSILSMQNEPQTCNQTYPTVEMQPSDQAKLSLDLSADLNNPANGLTNPPKIMGYDHNWYSPGEGSTSCFGTATYGPTTYPQNLMALSNDVSDIGYHSYCGSSLVQNSLSSAHPNVGIYVTESTGVNQYSDAGTNLVNEIKNDLIDPIRDGASGSLYWNFALNQNCGPQFGGGTTCNYCPKSGPQPPGTTCNKKESSSYGGCMDCRPMVTVDNQNGTYSLNQDYYYWAQFSKFIQPGAVRIWSSTIGSSLDTVAFQNPDGEIVLVVLSSSTANSIPLPLELAPDYPETPVITQGQTFFSQSYPVTIGTSSSEVLSGDSAGTAEFAVDDAMSMTVTHPDGSTASFIYNFNTPDCSAYVPAGPFPVSSLFEPGRNVVTVTLYDVCGIDDGVQPGIWLSSG